MCLHPLYPQILSYQMRVQGFFSENLNGNSIPLIVPKIRTIVFLYVHILKKLQYQIKMTKDVRVI